MDQRIRITSETSDVLFAQESDFQSAPSNLARWESDPATFARDIGVELDEYQEDVLRAFMRGDAPTSFRDLREANRIRRVIGRRLEEIRAEDATPGE
jgi:hypothetical protein